MNSVPHCSSSSRFSLFKYYQLSLFYIGFSCLCLFNIVIRLQQLHPPLLTYLNLWLDLFYYSSIDLPYCYFIMQSMRGLLFTVVVLLVAMSMVG